MKYRYRIWCGDCCSIDPYGCFDGGTELSEDVYDSYKEADEAGDKDADRCSVWEYCVTDEDGNEVDAPEEREVIDET